MLDAVCTHVTSSAVLRDSAVKLTHDSYQFWVAHENVRETFQSHIQFAKVQKYGDAFSKSSSIYITYSISSGLYKIIWVMMSKKVGFQKRIHVIVILPHSIFKDRVYTIKINIMSSFTIRGMYSKLSFGELYCPLYGNSDMSAESWNRISENISDDIPLQMIILNMVMPQ